MTESAATPAPKKSGKTLLVLILLLLSLLGLDNQTFHFISGTDVTVTDSTIVISETPSVVVDSAKAVAPIVDTTKK